MVHEAGHFLSATWQGIRVSGFSIGFGPVLLQGQRRGGFVAFPDDDADSDIPKTNHNLISNRPLPQHASPAAHHETETSHHLVRKPAAPPPSAP